MSLELERELKFMKERERLEVIFRIKGGKYEIL